MDVNPTGLALEREMSRLPSLEFRQNLGSEEIRWERVRWDLTPFGFKPQAKEQAGGEDTTLLQA
jgi:hypothetical protein